MSKKPKIWKMTVVGKRKHNKIIYEEGYIFPCSDKCIVSAACKLYCYKVFNYMNFIADEIYLMTADQIETYRKTTPLSIRRKVQEFYTYNKRLAHPDTATVSRDWK